MHRATAEESANRILLNVQDCNTSLYADFEDNPSIFLPFHQYPFTTQFMADRLLMSYDATPCWIHLAQ
jgi:hypothetical protein